MDTLLRAFSLTLIEGSACSGFCRFPSPSPPPPPLVVVVLLDHSHLYLLAQNAEYSMNLQIVKEKCSSRLSNVDDMEEIVLKTLERIEIIRPSDSLEFLASLKVLEVEDATLLSNVQTLLISNFLVFFPFLRGKRILQFLIVPAHIVSNEPATWKSKVHHDRWSWLILLAR